MRASTIMPLLFLVTAGQATDFNQSTSQNYRCKPVFLLHGLLQDNSSMEFIETRIKQTHPGTLTFNSNAYPGLQGVTPLWDQIQGIVGQELKDFCDQHPDGITAIGHSQGALLIRAFMETHPNHTIHNFISVASVHRGHYGVPSFYGPLLPFLQIPFFLGVDTDFFYRRSIQDTISVANGWNDPHRFQDYLERNIYLPLINNENPSNWNQTFKDGFLKQKRHVTIAGPDDAVVIPWQSGQYEFFDENENVVSYQNSDIYKRDTFGLRTLDESGRWVRHVIPGLNHLDFVADENVFQKAILPYLDCTEKIGT